MKTAEPTSVVLFIEDSTKLTSSQWRISHLSRDHYKFQNVDFESFISHDPRPQVDDLVLGKGFAIPWIVHLLQTPNIYS